VFRGQAQLQTVPRARLHSYAGFLRSCRARLRACSTGFNMRFEPSLSVWCSHPIKISMEPGPAKKSTKHTASFVNGTSGPAIQSKSQWFCSAWALSTQPGYSMQETKHVLKLRGLAGAFQQFVSRVRANCAYSLLCRPWILGPPQRSLPVICQIISNDMCKTLELTN
jgi:hypothetical protein